MIFPFPSQKYGHCLQGFFFLLCFVFCCLYGFCAAAGSRSYWTAEDKSFVTFVCNCYGSVRILQEVRVKEVRAWSWTRVSCDTQRQKKIPETERWGWGLDGREILLGTDPNTAYEHPLRQGLKNMAEMASVYLQKTTWAWTVSSLETNVDKDLEGTWLNSPTKYLMEPLVKPEEAENLSNKWDEFLTNWMVSRFRAE